MFFLSLLNSVASCFWEKVAGVCCENLVFLLFLSVVDEFFTGVADVSMCGWIFYWIFFVSFFSMLFVDFWLLRDFCVLVCKKE